MAEWQHGTTLYEARGGDPAIRKLVETFYPIVQRDPVIGPLFPEDLEPVKEKQFLFLTQFFGGPPLYSMRYGHPMMRARHLHVPINVERADAWLNCMREALTRIGIDPELKEIVLERLRGPAYHFVNQN